MLKKFNIHKKMQLGFGAIILLLVITSMIFLVISLRIEDQISLLGDVGHIRTDIVEALHYQTAVGVNAPFVLNEINNDRYDEMTDAFANLTKSIDKLKNSAIENGYYWQEDIILISDALILWQDYLDEVEAHNKNLSARFSRMELQMDQINIMLEGLHQSMLRDIRSNTMTRADLAAAIDPFVLLCRQAEKIRFNFPDDLSLFSREDQEKIGSEAELAIIYAQTAINTGVLPEAVLLQFGRVLASLEEYHAEMIRFSGENQISQVLVKPHAEELGVYIADGLKQLGDSLQGDIVQLLSKAITLSRLTLVVIFIITLAAVILAFGISIVISRSIADPLKRMKDLLNKIGANGEIIISEEENRLLEQDALNHDEVGQSFIALRKMRDHLQVISHALECIAAQDLTVSITPLSPSDTMSNALLEMCDQLNLMVQDIIASANTVASGATELAASSQQLSSVTVEQAINSKNLENTAEEIEQQATKSLEKAVATLEQGLKASEAAKEGSEYIRQMESVFKEISASGKSVKAVLKVIEDISFQTNILSLNASIEASRAGGEHGRAFSVVAQEVRRLAIMSSQSAKDTAALIEASNRKTERNLQVLTKVSEMLTRVLSEMDAAGGSMADVQRYVKVQFDAIKDMSASINAISNFTQQNSAAAQQTVATSEELSTQAQQLYNLVSQFKLKDNITFSSNRDFGWKGSGGTRYDESYTMTYTLDKDGKKEY